MLTKKQTKFNDAYITICINIITNHLKSVPITPTTTYTVCEKILKY